MACLVHSNLFPRSVVADDAEDGPAVHVLRPAMRTFPHDLRIRWGMYLYISRNCIGGCVRSHVAVPSVPVDAGNVEDGGREVDVEDGLGAPRAGRKSGAAHEERHLDVELG